MKTSFLLFFLTYLCLSFNSTAQGWKWAIGSSCPNADFEQGPMAVDKNGNVYAAGFVIQGTPPVPVPTTIFGSDTIYDNTGVGWQTVLVSADANGHARWAIGTQNGRTWVHDIKVDPYDNVYILATAPDGNVDFGLFSIHSAYSSTAFVAKISSSGTVLWLKEIIPPLFPYQFCINSSGNIYFAGTFTINCMVGPSSLTKSTADLTPDIYIAKYDSALNPLWAVGFGGDSAESAYAIALTTDSEIYVTGAYSSPVFSVGTTTLTNTSGGAFSNIFLAKFSSTGSPLWARSATVTDNMDGAAGLAADNKGSVYVTGTYNGDLSFGSYVLPNTAGFLRPFLCKYDSSGTVKWAKTIDYNPIVSACMVDADNCGNIWICGQGGPHLTSPSDPMYHAQFDSTGTLLDTIFLQSGGDDASYMTLDKKGNVYVCGDYSFHPLILGRDTLLLKDGSDETLFMAKYIYDLPNCVPDTTDPNENTLVRNINAASATITLYPNPASDEFVIHCEAIPLAGNKVELCDMTGRLVKSYLLNTNNTAVSVSGYPPGMYQCRIFLAGNAVATKKLVVIH